jgi:hypothetical protein
MVQKIAKVMADFYLIAETNKEIATYGLPEKIWVNVKENFDQTASYINHIISKDLYNDLRDYSLSFLTEKKQWFLNRIANGQIKDGHGDFHCANIYYYKNQVYVLDCIEFNKRFRYADVGADVAFLLMDLDFRSASTLGNYFLNSYLAQNNDFSLLSVLNFYKIYRAYVRGKINSFKTNMAAIAKEQKQEAYRQAKAYFSLAHSYLFKPSYPYILATTGLLGSGKTTLALALAAHLGAIVIHSDAVRKHLAGVSPNKHLYAPFAKGIYAEEMTERVYEKLIFLSSEILSYGYTVILDASFNKEKYRHKLRKLAQKMGLPYYFLYCQCDEDIIKGRLEQRQKKGMDISDAYLGLFDTFKKGFEPLVDKRQFKVKTDESIQRAVEKIIRYFNET